MQGAEDASHQLRVGAVFVQLQQSRLQIDEDLARFFAEALLELVGVVCGCLIHGRLHPRF